MTDQTLDLDAIPELTRRLRGVYRIPITDGCGAVGGGDEPDNPDEYVRSFQTPPIQLRAADALDALTAEVRKLREALDKCGRAIRQNRHASYRLNRVSEIVDEALKALKPKEPSA